jgi:hypothetical protein
MNLIRVFIATLCIVGCISVFLPWTSLSHNLGSIVIPNFNINNPQDLLDGTTPDPESDRSTKNEETSYPISTTKGINGMGKLTLVLFLLTAILSFIGDIKKETFDNSWVWLMGLSAGNFALTLIFTMLTPDLNAGFMSIHVTYEFPYWLALICTVLVAVLIVYSKYSEQNIFRNKVLFSSKASIPQQGE